MDDVLYIIPCKCSFSFRSFQAEMDHRWNTMLGAGADPEFFFQGGGSEPRTLNFNKPKKKSQKGGGGSLGVKQLFCVTVCLYFLFIL